jgi:hypothetical protein
MYANQTVESIRRLDFVHGLLKDIKQLDIAFFIIQPPTTPIVLIFYINFVQPVSFDRGIQFYLALPEGVECFDLRICIQNGNDLKICIANRDLGYNLSSATARQE